MLQVLLFTTVSNVGVLEVIMQDEFFFFVGKRLDFGCLCPWTDMIGP